MLIKKLNQMAILRTIQNAEPVSRYELARMIGLSNSTVSTLVADLIEAGIVKEMGEGKSIGGRKPIMLGINDEGGYIIGIDIGSAKISCGVINLRSQIHDRLTIDTPGQPERIVPAIVGLINEMKGKELPGGRRTFLGVGIATPGYVDIDNGILVNASNLNWRDVELRKEVEYGTGLKTVIDNNTNAAALGEHYYGTGANVDDFIYMAVGNGIGGGIMVGGSLLTGSRNGAGEIGHMKMSADGPLCSCGKRGCLEAYASGRAVERMAAEATDRSAAMRRIYEANGAVTAKSVFELAAEGEPAAKSILETVFGHLANATASLINIFNPQLVIFGGGLAKAGDLFLNGIVDRVRPIVLPEQNSGVQFALSSLGEDSGILGAATLVIQQLFRPIKTAF